MESLQEINQTDKKTVVVSLHQVDYAMRYCSRTVALREGKIVYDGPSAVLNSAMLRDLYGADCDELLSENAEPAIQNIRPLPTPQLDAPITAATA